SGNAPSLSSWISFLGAWATYPNRPGMTLIATRRVYRYGPSAFLDHQVLGITRTRAIARENHASPSDTSLFLFLIFQSNFCLDLFNPLFMSIVEQLICRLIPLRLIKGGYNLVDGLQNSHLTCVHVVLCGEPFKSSLVAKCFRSSLVQYASSLLSSP